MKNQVAAVLVEVSQLRNPRSLQEGAIGPCAIMMTFASFYLVRRLRRHQGPPVKKIDLQRHGEDGPTYRKRMAIGRLRMLAYHVNTTLNYPRSSPLASDPRAWPMWFGPMLGIAD